MLSARSTLMRGVIATLVLVVIVGVWLRHSSNQLDNPSLSTEATVRGAVHPETVDDPFLSARAGEEAAGDSRKVAATAGSRLVIKVMGEDHAPIRRATVWVRTDANIVSLGTTNDAGLLDAILQQAVGGTIVCNHPSYQPSEYQLPGTLPRSVEIVMKVEAEISGRVAWREGKDKLQGVQVIAYPDGLLPALADLRVMDAGIQTSSLHRVVVEENGSFSIGGLARLVHYSLMAAGNGGTTVLPVTGVVSGAEAVDLKLEPLFALVVLLREQGGAETRVGDDVWGQGPSWRPTMEQIKFLTKTPVGYYLNVHASEWELPETAKSQLFVFLGGSADLESIGVDYFVGLPGYAPIHTQLAAARARASPGRIEVQLSPLGVKWGSVSFMINTFSAGVSVDSGNSRNFGMLQLDEEHGSRVLIPIYKPCPTALNITGIPCGSYHVSFRMNDWPYHESMIDPLDAVVGEEPGNVFLNLSGVGSVYVDAVDEDGRQYTGAIVLNVTQNKVSSIRCFDRAPYVIEGLPAGNFAISAAKANDIDFLTSREDEVSIVPGVLVSTVLMVQRDKP